MHVLVYALSEHRMIYISCGTDRVFFLSIFQSKLSSRSLFSSFVVQLHKNSHFTDISYFAGPT